MSALRALLILTGLVAVVAGAFGAIAGIEGMSGDSAGTPNVDSEYRFLSVFWLAFGAFTIRVARRPRIEPGAARALMLVLFCAGVARALSWALEGRPDGIYVVLLALELGVPIIVLMLLAREGRSLLEND